MQNLCIKKTIAWFLVLSIILPITACNEKKSLDSVWGDIYYEYIEDNIEEQPYSDIECQMMFLPIKEEVKPLMVAKYKTADEKIIRLHHIGYDNQVETAEIKSANNIDLKMIYNRQLKACRWYAVYRENDITKYKDIVEQFQSLGDASIVGDYSFNDAETKESNTKDGITKFDETFIVPNVQSVKTFNSMPQKELFDSMKNAIDNYISIDEIANNEIYAEMEKKEKEFVEIAYKAKEEQQTVLLADRKRKAKEFLTDLFDDEKNPNVDWFLGMSKFSQFMLICFTETELRDNYVINDYDKVKLTNAEINKIQNTMNEDPMEGYGFIKISLLQNKYDKIYGLGKYNISNILDDNDFITDSGYLAFPIYARGLEGGGSFYCFDFDNMKVKDNYILVYSKSLGFSGGYDPTEEIKIYDNYTKNIYDRDIVGSIYMYTCDTALAQGRQNDSFNFIARECGIDTKYLNEKVFVLYEKDGQVHIWDYGYPDEVTYPS